MNISKNFINKIFSKEAISSLVVILIVFILDRALKIKIINKQENSNGSIFINDYLNAVSTFHNHNTPSNTSNKTIDILEGKK